MAETRTLTAEMNDTLQQAAQDARQLEALLARVLQVITDNGFQISVDILGMTRDISQRIERAQRQNGMLNNQLDRLAELLRTFSLITSTLDLEQVLSDVMDTIIRLTGAERAYLMLRDKATSELNVVVARNWERQTISEHDSSFSWSIVERALSERSAILATNAAADDRFQNMQSVVNNQLRSVLCIPLLLHGSSVGVLYVDNRITQDVFRQEEIPLLTAFGTQAAIAIENARMYGEVKEDLNKALSELQSLQIQIDQGKVERQVSQITESDYFQRLSVAARNMRRRFDDEVEE
ncbi:MAG: GAF domain-containing protein [Blastochloris sp.]|nr:GAF domain-containing protein [Blastochloris sp.]